VTVDDLCRVSKDLTVTFQDRFTEGSDTQVFNSGDCMETVSFDPINFRIVATSHNGKIKMFRLDRDGMRTLRF